MYVVANKTRQDKTRQDKTRQDTNTLNFFNTPLFSKRAGNYYIFQSLYVKDNLIIFFIKFLTIILFGLFKDIFIFKKPKLYSNFYLNDFWKYYYENNILIKNLKNVEKIGEGEKNAI